MDFSTLDEQMSSNMNDMYQPSKVDVFIVKAYKIVTNGTILNSSHITTSSSTTLTAGGDDPNNDTNSTTSSNSKNSRRKKNLSGIHPQYSKTFVKISKIYNSLISSGLFGDISTSPKSDIELFQRFQQILKELELNFNMSPYAKFFNKISDTLFQVKEDNELTFDDPYWTDLTNGILNFYNPRTGKIINQGRKKNIIRKNVAANNNSNNNSNTDGNPADFFNISNNILDDPTLSLQLHKKLQMIPQDVSSRSLNGYYTQPTSPGSSGFPFNLGGTDEDLLNNTFNNNNGNGNGNGTGNNNINSNNDGTMNYNNSNLLNNGNYNYMNHKKRRSLSSLNFDENAMDDLLKFTNLSKRQKTSMNFNNIIDDFRFPSNNSNDTNDKQNMSKLNDTQSTKQSEKDVNTINNNNADNNNNGNNYPNENSVNNDNNDNVNSSDNNINNSNNNNTANGNNNDSNNSNNNNNNNNNSSLLASIENELINSNDKNNNSGTASTTDPGSMVNTNVDSNRLSTMQITPESNHNPNTNPNSASLNMSSQSVDSGSNTGMMAGNSFSVPTAGTTTSLNAGLEIYFQELVSKYNMLLSEKDRRIKSLEAELESQRQETLWLRKLLIEDMGCIRNLLQNMQK